jgi:membrane protein YqaA with SNARE-associated domain
LKKISEILYGVKAWIEHFASKPYALWVLWITACLEASVFPVPPDVLLIALAVARPKRSFLYAAICVGGSTAGALIGYYIGYSFFEVVVRHIVDLYGLQSRFNSVLVLYKDNAWTALLLAGFTSIPFSIFTIAAGFNETIDVRTFVVATLAGRSLRFFLLASLLFVFGPAIKAYLDKYLERFSIAVGVLFVLGILIMQWFL